MNGKKLEDQPTLGSYFSRFYEDLRRIARVKMAREPQNLTLQPTGLVHAVYQKLRKGPPQEAPGTKGFWGLARQAMDNELVDIARARQSQKRGGDVVHVPLSQASDQLANDPHIGTLFDNSEVMRSALSELGKIEPNGQRMVNIIILYYYEGLNWRETASALGVSRKQVQRDWGFARTWLFDYITFQDGEGD
ncbi:MAG: hypothetical protein KJ970_19280 [Candidatus Eisenbacteria bacterium]|uniref:RNA polymerase sigma-70 ECF-like HTH domain-containing protein n=1 Tax=Eiseniibacteriota bacterium TaxID=2212470 RepID=A0A948S3D5_UNCEI|nr:hypothetical protein [Candidatus Eisenbacteria bacterium]MBU1949728.1 hypothetical protein [Candidatus Eisenbacteria bacterium]MBU2693064.1 hypothetical protein [Candidatus Eisenbacteria bacterium]